MGNGASVDKLEASPNVRMRGSLMFISKSENVGLVQRMEWAASFIGILPIPVCLIDKKGFVHHTNDIFNEMVSIEFDANCCPFVGRFFEDLCEMRSKIEIIEASNVIINLPLKVKWRSDSLKGNKTANVSFEWSMSGSGNSDGVVITGREVNIRRNSILTFTEKLAETEEKLKVEKYKAALEKRKLKAAAERKDVSVGEGDLMAQSKWGRFYKRVNEVRAEDAAINANMESFMEVLKKVASDAEEVEITDNAMIGAAEETGVLPTVEEERDGVRSSIKFASMQLSSMRGVKEGEEERSEAAAVPPVEAAV